MLEMMRSKQRSFIVIIIFAFIVIVFVFMGMGPNGQNGGRIVVGSVNGEKVFSDDYQRLYRSQANYIRQNLKGEASEEMLNSSDFKLNVMQNVVNKMLIVGEAESAGLTVSAEELQTNISSIEAFHANGVFDARVYRELLSQNNILPGDFERYRKEELLATKMESKVRSAVVVTPDEVRDSYFRDNAKISLNYIALEGKSFLNKVDVIEEDARTLLRENPARFMIEAELDVLYAYANFSDVAGSIEVPEEKVKDYYEQNKKIFTTSKEVSASHILIGPANADSRTKIDEVMARLLSGADFGEMAKEYSTDRGTKDNGGSLGFFGEGAMVPTFEKAAFALNVGETSGIIETRFGYHIVKLDGMKEESLTPLTGAVYENIKGLIAEKDARNVTYERVKSVRASLSNLSTKAELKKVALEAGVKYRSTGLFSRFDKSEEILTDQNLTKAVFRLNEGETSNIIDTPLGLYVLKVVKKIDEHPPTFEDAKSKVIAEYKKDEALKLAKFEADILMELLKGGSTLEAIASDKNWSLQSTKLFAKKDNKMPGTDIFIGNDDKMFALTMEEPVYNDVLSKGDTHYIFSLKQKHEADAAQFSAMYEQIEKGLVAARSNKAYSEWLEGVRNKSKIVIKEELL